MKRRLPSSQEIVWEPYRGPNVIALERKQKRSWWTKGNREPKGEPKTYAAREKRQQEIRNAYRKPQKVNLWHGDEWDDFKSTQEKRIAWNAKEWEPWEVGKMVRERKAAERKAYYKNLRENWDIVRLGNGQVKHVKKVKPSKVIGGLGEGVWMVFDNMGSHFENEKGEICTKSGAKPRRVLSDEMKQQIARNKLAAQIRLRKAIAQKKLKAKYPNGVPYRK